LQSQRNATVIINASNQFLSAINKSSLGLSIRSLVTFCRSDLISFYPFFRVIKLAMLSH